MLEAMSETSSTPEPSTTPVATTAPPQPAYVETEPRRSRLPAVAAWVGIVAGVVFIVAVLFFSGFVVALSCPDDDTIVTIPLGDAELSRVVSALSEQGIIVAARDGNLRISIHFYNHEDDIHRLATTLGAAVRGS